MKGNGKLKKIGSDIVMIASRMRQTAFSNGRYSDSPERNGIPCKYFAFVSADLSEEELEAECGAKLEIDEANISVVLDDPRKGYYGSETAAPIFQRIADRSAKFLAIPPELILTNNLAVSAIPQASD